MSNDPTKIALPIIHSNGTSREMLLRGYTEAYYALDEAIRKFEAIEFNGRDYYLKGPEHFKQAQAEYEARWRKLCEVRSELLVTMNHISDV